MKKHIYKKILVLLFVFIITSTNHVFANIEAEPDFNDSIAFTSWYKIRKISSVTYYSFVKNVANDRQSYWFRVDNNTYGHYEKAELKIDGHKFLISQIETNSKYDRLGIPEPKLWRAWATSFYAFTDNEINAIKNCKTAVSLTFFLKNGDQLVFNVPEEILKEWQQIIDLEKADFEKIRSKR